MRLLDLGPLLVELDDGARSGAGGQRPAALLTRLVMHANHRVGVDDLIEAVWGEDVSATASSTLETHVWRLRRLLEPGRQRGQASSVLVNDSGGYRLVLRPEQVDSLTFEQQSDRVRRLSEQGDPLAALATADDALRRWRGRAFEALADELWALGRVQRLEELRNQVEELRVDALLATGAEGRALGLLGPLIAAEPYRERLWAQRMLALHRTGRTEEALQAYREVRRELRDGAGLDPGVELHRLHSRILDADLTLLRLGEPAVVRPRRRTDDHLPTAVPLVGRAEAQQQVAGLLAPGQVTTLVGPAGVGKTALALAVARAALDGSDDEAWFVDLTAVDGDDVVAAVVASRLGLAVPPEADVLDFLAAWATARSLVLVLDGCEQVLDGVAAVSRVLAAPASLVTVLVTSREALGVPGERVHRLAPLDVLAPDGGEGPATALFRAHLPEHVRDALDQEGVRLVADICRAVDGLPLAIELAAGLTEAYGLADLAARVTQDPAHLASVGRGRAAHHQSVHEAVDRSYAPLSEQEQLLHRRLAVLPGPFSTEAAAAVAAPLPGWSVGGLLGRLVHRSLLAPLPSREPASATRFAQLSPVRGHARHLLGEGDELAAARGGLETFVRGLLADRPPTGAPGTASWLARLEDDLAGVRGAFRSASTTSSVLAADVARATMAYWYYRGRGLEGRRWLETALAAQGLPSTERALTELGLAAVLATQGQSNRAERLAEGALDALPDEHPHLAELAVNAAVSFTERDHDLKHRLLAPAHRVLQATGDPGLRVLVGAAELIADLGRLDPDEMVTRGVALHAEAVEVGNDWAAWMSCSSVNVVALAREDAEQGLLWSRRLLQHQRSMGARTPSLQLETWGVFLALGGHHQAAVQVLAAAHSQARHSGYRWPRFARTERLLAEAAVALGTPAYDRAWSSGPSLSLAELVGIVD